MPDQRQTPLSDADGIQRNDSDVLLPQLLEERMKLWPVAFDLARAVSE